MFDLLRSTFREFMDDDCPRLAAALSYYTIFSLPPLLVLTLLIASAFVDPADVSGRLVNELGGVLGESGAEQVREMIGNADRPGSGGALATILSLAALLFGATGAFAQLQAALNKAWEVRRDPEVSGIRAFALKRVLSFGMVLVIAFLLLVSLVLSTVLSRAAGEIAGALPGGTALLWVFDIGLSLALMTLLFAAMFVILPDAEVAWKDVWVGAGATALLFVVGKFLIGFYIARSNPGDAFGAAGSLAVVLVWIYYSGLILFLGAELTQVWARRRGSGIRPDDGAVRVGAEGMA